MHTYSTVFALKLSLVDAPVQDKISDGFDSDKESLVKFRAEIAAAAVAVVMAVAAVAAEIAAAAAETIRAGNLRVREEEMGRLFFCNLYPDTFSIEITKNNILLFSPSVLICFSVKICERNDNLVNHGLAQSHVIHAVDNN
ncbi:MAG: hypothetical protein LC768_12250 [Acidobacteria bacterium]|nr:hypothetical protein [Acidobacteriota bacterium]